MEDHKTNDEKSSTLEEIRAARITNPSPLKLQLDPKLRTENLNNPEFFENYSRQIYLDSNNRKKFKWANIILIISSPILWGVNVFFILELANYLDINSSTMTWVSLVLLILSSLLLHLSGFARSTHREYLKSEANLLYGYKTPSWKRAIQRNYRFNNYSFGDVNLDHDQSSLINNLEDKKVESSRTIMYRIYLFSALNFWSHAVLSGLAIAALIISQNS